MGTGQPPRRDGPQTASHAPGRVNGRLAAPFAGAARARDSAPVAIQPHPLRLQCLAYTPQGHGRTTSRRPRWPVERRRWSRPRARRGSCKRRQRSKALFDEGMHLRPDFQQDMHDFLNKGAHAFTTNVLNSDVLAFAPLFFTFKKESNGFSCL